MPTIVLLSSHNMFWVKNKKMNYYALSLGLSIILSFKKPAGQLFFNPFMECSKSKFKKFCSLIWFCTVSMSCKMNTLNQYTYLALFCFHSLRPSQQFFSHVGTGLPRLNQYLTADKVPWSRIQHSDSDG